MLCVFVVCFTLVFPQSHRQCFDVYKVHLESVKQERRGSRQFDFEPEVIESGQIIPNVSSDGIVTLNVTTNSTLSTNKFYNATLITAMDMVESESIQFCKYTYCHKLVSTMNSLVGILVWVSG